MKPLALLLGLFAFGVNQAASSRPSNRIEEDDFSALMAMKPTRDLAAADTNAFTAANVVVELGDEDTSNGIIEDNLKQLEEGTDDLASNEAGDTNIKDLDKLPKEWSHLGNNLEQKDVAEANLLHAVQARAESYLDSTRSKISEGHGAMFGVGLTVLLIAVMVIVICLCGNMRRRGPYEESDLLQEGCEVWERVVVESPHKARETRIKMLVHEIRGPDAEESITASDLQDLMKDPRVRHEFEHLGIDSFHDAMPSFNILVHKSSDGVSVNLMEFLSVSTSPDGQLLRLFTELDEATSTSDAPPGFLSEDNLHHILQEPRLEAKLTSLGLSPDDLFPVFRRVQSGKGLVDIEEFVPALTKMKSRMARQISGGLRA